MSDVRVGLVGLGSVGRTHARALANLDGVELVAVSGGANVDLAELGWPDAERVGHDDLAARTDLDIVAICGPSALHAEQAIRALNAGSNVVVEKPLALTVEDAEAVVAAAKQTGRQVSVVSQRRLEPQNQYVKAKLDAGELGTPILGEAFLHWHRDDAYYAHAAWRSQQNEGGGSLFNQAVHNVDLLNWLLGPVEEVTAQYGTLGHPNEAEDTTVATLRFASNALGVVVSTTATKPGDPARAPRRLHQQGCDRARERRRRPLGRPRRPTTAHPQHREERCERSRRDRRHRPRDPMAGRGRCPPRRPEAGRFRRGRARHRTSALRHLRGRRQRPSHASRRLSCAASRARPH